MSGAVSRLPLEARGLAPRIIRWSVRSTSGTGTLNPVPNISPEANCFGVLVDRGGGVDVARSERLEEHAAVEHRGEVVGRRVADVDAHGVAPVLAQDRRQPLVDLREGLVPADGLEVPARGAAHRGAQAVGILVQGLQRHALGAEEAVREDVLGVAADGRHVAVATS